MPPHLTNLAMRMKIFPFFGGIKIKSLKINKKDSNSFTYFVKRRYILFNVDYVSLHDTTGKDE